MTKQSRKHQKGPVITQNYHQNTVLSLVTFQFSQAGIKRNVKQGRFFGTRLENHGASG